MRRRTEGRSQKTATGPGSASGDDEAPDDETDPAPETTGAHTVTDALNRLVRVGCLDNAQGTVTCYLQRGGHLMRLLGEIPVRALHLDDVHSYCARRLQEGAARETIRKELVTLRRSLKLAAERGLLRTDPNSLIPRFKAPYKPRERWLRPEEFDRLLDQFRPGRQLWLLLAAMGSCRASEVEKLQWHHVDLAGGKMLIPGTKTRGSYRKVPIHPRLRQALESSPGPRTGPLVAPWVNRRRALMQACARLKMDHVCANDLRRTFASWLKQAHVDTFVVSQLLGHSSTRMVELVYGRLSPEVLESAVMKLPGAANGNGE